MAKFTDKTDVLFWYAHRAVQQRKDFTSYNPFTNFISSIHLIDFRTAQISSYDKRVFINFPTKKEYKIEADLSDLGWLAIWHKPKTGDEEHQLIHVNWQTLDWNTPNKFYMTPQDKEVLDDFYQNFIHFIRDVIKLKTANVVPFDKEQFMNKIFYVQNLLEHETSDVAEKLNSSLNDIVFFNNFIRNVEQDGNITIVKFWNTSKMFYDTVNSTIVVQLTKNLGLMILATMTKPRLKLVHLKSNPKETFGNTEGVSLDRSAICSNLNEIAKVLTQIMIGAAQ